MFSLPSNIAIAALPLQLSWMEIPCINVMAVGDAGCGKTCLFTRLSKNKFWDGHVPLNFHNGNVDSDNEDVDIDNEVVDIENQTVDILFGRDELKISFFTSGETFARLAGLYGCHV